MASQRRAPTKRPPRPAAKKSPPAGDETVTDATERPTTTPKPGAAPASNTAAPGKAASTGATATGATGTTPETANGAGTKTAPTTAKTAPTAGVVKTNAGGGNYRPPTGAARSRRPPPPPKRKRPKITTRTIGAIVALALIGALVVFFSVAVNGGSSSPSLASALTPEGIPVPNAPVLAAVNAASYPQPIDGITCGAETVAYHIHAHLAIFVNGAARQIPYGVGITPPLSLNSTNGIFVSTGTCFYWLHTHAADGVIHVESPTQSTYTLGQFFDLWGQPLMAGQVGPAVGRTTVYVNGKAFTGDPRTIQLSAHENIQLDVGSPAPAPVSIDWSKTSL